jgi:putative ubiquitin-RnfH superfamily antitoxin RatB of RatAB toxin-antitoxin module
MIAGTLNQSVEIVWSPNPRVAKSINFNWVQGQTVLSALWVHRSELSEYLQLITNCNLDQNSFMAHLEQLKLKGVIFMSIWGHPCQMDTLLNPMDRIELSRSLKVDPKVARRERFQAQGAKSAGLFAKKRPGAKPGY